MNAKKKYQTAFNYIDAIELRGDIVDRCSHQGDCEADVRECMSLPSVKKELARIDPEQLRKELREYGAWDDTELDNHDENLMRILWIAAGNIQDEN